MTEGTRRDTEGHGRTSPCIETEGRRDEYVVRSPSVIVEIAPIAGDGGTSPRVGETSTPQNRPAVSNSSFGTVVLAPAGARFGALEHAVSTQ